jgi:hypothetical protein
MASELSEATRRTVLDRIPNYNELLADDLEAAAIRVIADDFYIYCERNLMILDKETGEISPFKLNWAQRKLVEMVLKDIADGLPVRYIVLKARQMGLSTVIEALGFWWTTTHRNIKTVIIAHETEAATTLYEMFKRYFDNAHPTFQPTRKYNNKKELVFDVEDNVKEEYTAVGMRSPGLGSSIRTMVADEGKGRGQMIQFFHGSEVAFWKVKADVVSAAMQAIPLRAGTFAFLESTANGVGGYFYKAWQNAKKKKSNFKAIFFAWHEHYEYEIHRLNSAGEPWVLTWYDEEETKLLELFETKGYPRETWDAKIMWRREKKKEFLDDPKKFYQEYPSTDMEAFLASGRPKFNIDQLVKMEQFADDLKTSDKRHHIFGDVVVNPDPVGKDKYVFIEAPPLGGGESDPTPLKVWELPIGRNPNTREEAKQYCIGVDVSEGKINKESEKKENDYSVVTVMRKDTNKVVARWRGHIDPDLLGSVVYALGTFYNNALVAVEVNNHGLTTVQSLRNKFYRNLYMRETSEENQFQERTALMGWRTDKKTKPLIINNLAKAIREGDILDLDVVCLRECMTYVVDDQGHTNAQEGQFDDCVMSLAIALEMTDYNSIDSEYAKDNIHKPVKRNKNASTTSTSALESIARPGVSRASNLDAVRRRRSARAAHKAYRRAR